MTLLMSWFVHVLNESASGERVIDATCIGEMVPNGYEFHHVPRSNGRTGGGVGIVFKTELSLKVTSSSASDADTSQFEYIDCCTDNNCATIRFVVVYRPPVIL